MKNKKGFTLIELLVVIAIIGILATIGLVSFISAQARSRDAKRKSDLKEVSSALELFYSDYGRYPGGVNGQMSVCPYSAAGGTVCKWGEGEFSDGKTTYFKTIPKDSAAGSTYFYRTVAVDSVPNSGYQIFARLENGQDLSILTLSEPICGTSVCNFAVTSPNTNPSASP